MVKTSLAVTEKKLSSTLMAGLLVGSPAFAFAQDAEPPASTEQSAIESEHVAANADESLDAEAESGPGTFRLPLFGVTAFGLTSSTTVAWRGDNQNRNEHDDNFFYARERLELSLTGETLRLSVRADGFVPYGMKECEPGQESLCAIEWDARPERVLLAWNPGEFSLEAGDTYAVLGRGLALSFRKADGLGIDNTVRGGSAAWDSHRFYVRAVGGLSNPQNLDPLTLSTFRDPDDVVVGAEAGFRIGENDEVDLGFHAARVWFERDSLGKQVTVSVGGWHVSAPSLLDGSLSLYGEANALQRDVDSQLIGDETSFGRALYGSAQYQSESSTLLFEFKDYRDFLTAPDPLTPQTYRIYSALPTFEREDQRVRAPHNARGAALKFDYAFVPSTWSVFTQLLGYGHDDEHRDPWRGILVTSAYVGTKRQSDPAEETPWSLEVFGGYRRETYLHDPFGEDTGKGDLDWSVVHGSVGASVGIGEHSLEAHAEHRWERRYVFGYTSFERGNASLTWSWKGKFIISPVLQWTTEKKGADVLYPAIEGKWEFLEGDFLRIYGGRSPGGPICSGGVCRDLPPFEGVEAEVVFRL